MRKIIRKISILTMLIIALTVSIVKAEQLEAMNANAQIVVENFLNCMNNEDSKAFNYIDTSNIELFNNVKIYVHNLKIKYKITNIREENNNYTIKTKIEASGRGWSVSGFKAEFEVKEINNEYKITNTTLFNLIGSENINLLVLRLMAIVLGTMFIGFAIIIIIVIRISKNG